LKRKHGVAAAVFTIVAVAGGVAAVMSGNGMGNEPPAVSFEEATLRVRVDISERRLYVEENGAQIGTYGVAVGTGSHPTPRGAFSSRRIIWNPRWVPPDSEWAKNERPRAAGDPKNPMGRVKIFFREPDYYIHGTNAESSIGTAASHGCLRMRNEDVIALARLMMEHGGAPVEPGLIRRLINNIRQTREVRLTNPVPIRVQS
jgi:lipoprotein-anchoring transpeptidase ErfK/SrfK